MEEEDGRWQDKRKVARERRKALTGRRKVEDKRKVARERRKALRGKRKVER